MKKLKNIVLALLVISLLVNPMYLTLRVHAANEEIAMSRISDTLQSVMENSTEEKIKVMIWLEDINTSSAVLSSTEAILAQAKATVSSRGLCENPIADAELFSQYKAKKKEVMRNCYTAYTGEFADSFLFDDEIIYLSIYSPVIIASLTESRISAVSNCSSVRSLDFYCDDVEQPIEAEANIDSNTRSNGMVDGNYCTMEYVKQQLAINNLINFVGCSPNDSNKVKIGVLDYGTPDVDFLSAMGLINSSNLTLHHFSDVTFSDYDYYDQYEDQLFHHHPTHILEVLNSIAPYANYYYATFCELSQPIWGYPNLDSSLIEEIEWLLMQNVDIISISLALAMDDEDGSITDGYDAYGPVCEYLDYIISDYWVTIVKSAGNVVENEEDEEIIHPGVSCGGMAYNVITVGNYDLVNACLFDESQYYDGTTLTNKPDVCAPGVLQLHYRFRPGLYQNVHGTSLSAPIISAISALIIAYYDDPFLKPLEIKSIICGGTWLQRNSSDHPDFKKYGTGVISGTQIQCILEDNSTAWDYFEPNELRHSYSFTIDEFTNADFVLVFEKSYYEGIGFDLGNLDIILYDDTDCIVASTSLKNNVEVLFEAIEGSGNFTLVVQQTEPINNNTDITEDICIFYSLTWKMYDR